MARDQFGCAVGPPPIAVEFNEREEDVSSDPPVEDGGDDVSEAPVGVGQFAEAPGPLGAEQRRAQTTDL